MNSEQLMVGNLAIASVIIKTIVSSIKLIFPSFTSNAMYPRLTTMILGVLSAFATNAQMLEIPEGPAWTSILQKVLAGLFIGATAIGVHETTKSIPTTKR